MIGNNSMEINEATMKEIVQHYFDNVLFTEKEKVKVSGVKGSQINSCASFTIQMQEITEVTNIQKVA